MVLAVASSAPSPSFAVAASSALPLLRRPPRYRSFLPPVVAVAVGCAKWKIIALKCRN